MTMPKGWKSKSDERSVNEELKKFPDSNSEKDIAEFKNKKKDFQRSFIILIGFGFFFLFFIFLPYSSIQNTKNQYQESKPLANNISSLSNSTERIFTLTTNMNNLLGTIKQDITTRYSELFNYFTQLESIGSELKSEEASNYTKASDSRTSIRTFLICGSINALDSIYCNARIMADNTADKILYNVREVVNNKLLPLEDETHAEYLEFDTLIRNIEHMSSTPIINHTSNKANPYNETLCLTKMSAKNNSYFRNINPSEACDFLSGVINIAGNVKTNEFKINQTSKDILYKGKDNISEWVFLRDPEFLSFYVGSGKMPDFSSIFKDVRKQNSQLQGQLQNLRVKFEQIEIPFIGKLPVTVESAMVFFPIVSSIGFVVCCYLINSAISIRIEIHKKLLREFENTLESNYIKPEYLWIQPEVLLESQKKTCKFMKFYLPLVIFFGAPIVFISLGLYFIYSLLSSESRLDIIEDVLYMDYPTFYFILLIAIFCIGLGMYLVIRKLWDYETNNVIKNGIKKDMR